MVIAIGPNLMATLLLMLLWASFLGALASLNMAFSLQASADGGRCMPATALHVAMTGSATRGSFDVAGPPRVVRSHGMRQPLMTWLVFFFVVLPCCTEAVGVGWNWGTRGGSCTSACTSVQQACVEGEFLKINNNVNFDKVKGVGVDCIGYGSDSDDWKPGRYDYPSGSSAYGQSYCYTQSGTSGTCAGTPPYSSNYRVCPCLCPANTFGPDLQTWPCPR